MALISLDEAKAYLRVDSADEDAVTGTFIDTACRLCADIARLSEEQWEAVDSDKNWSKYFSASRLSHIRETMKVAVLYAVGYLYEHREKADYTELTLTLRSLLFAIREGVV